MGNMASNGVTARLVRSAATIVLVASLGACARYHGAARFVSDPPGAEVVSLDDGALLGVTPFTVWWEQEQKVQRRLNVLYRKDGYKHKSAATYVTVKHRNKNEAYNDIQTVSVVLSPE